MKGEKPLKVSRHADYNVYGGSNVKYTKMNNITEVKYISRINKENLTRKINKDEYIMLETGEICEYKHSENRSENMKGIRQSIGVLRQLINNNFTGGSNELWITLTFGENKVYNPSQLCDVFEKFMKRLRYYFRGQKLDYIYVPEPHEKRRLAYTSFIKIR